MRYFKLISMSTILTALAFFGAALPTGAVDTGSVTKYSDCMQDIAGFNLNCTANDISIAGVYDINGDGLVDERDITIHDDGCSYPGDSVEFTATFIVELNAKARHDIGIYFATDGDLPAPVNRPAMVP